MEGHTVLAKANKEAAVAKAQHAKAPRAAQAEDRLRLRQHLKQLAAQTRPDPLKGLPVFPQTPVDIWWK